MIPRLEHRLICFHVIPVLALSLLIPIASVTGVGPDFSLLPEWTHNIGSPGAPVLVTGLNGFSGNITFTISYSADWAGLSKNSTILSPTFSQDKIFIYSRAYKPGDYQVTVTGTYHSLSHSVTIYSTVIPPTAPRFWIHGGGGGRSFGKRILGSLCSGIGEREQFLWEG